MHIKVIFIISSNYFSQYLADSLVCLGLSWICLLYCPPFLIALAFSSTLESLSRFPRTVAKGVYSWNIVIFFSYLAFDRVLIENH